MKTSESQLGYAVMQVLFTKPQRKAKIRTLINEVPDFISLTDEDRQPSITREGEEMWEQRVRNLKSHSKVAGNVIAEGLVAHVGRATYQLTEAGLLHLRNKRAA